MPTEYLQTGALEFYSPDTLRMSMSSPREAFSVLVRERLLASRVDADRADQPRSMPQPFQMHGEIQRSAAEARGVRQPIPQHFAEHQHACASRHCQDQML